MAGTRRIEQRVKHMGYTITAGGEIRRESDGAIIRVNAGDAGYQEYRLWAAKNAASLPAGSPELPVELKRRLAYPSAEEQLEALFTARQGDSTKLTDIDNRIDAVDEQISRGA